MEYARNQDGKIVVGVPTVGIRPDGGQTTGYNLLDNDELVADGWKPYRVDIPEYNPDTQCVEFVRNEETDTEIVGIYEVKDKVSLPPPPTMEELMAENVKLRDEVDMLSPAVDFIMLTVVPMLFPAE